MKKAPPRRTQEERRTGTIRKLLDAATATLVEVGYAGASVQVICERAGVSQGALFRHFPTREALMVAVGQDVGKKTLARYRRDFAALGESSSDALALSIRLLRDRCRSRLNVAWYELSMAARTSANLKRALRPVAQAYHDDIERLACELVPDLARSLGPLFPVLVDTIVAIFDGETVRRIVRPNPELEAARLALIPGLVALAPRAGGSGAISK